MGKNALLDTDFISKTHLIRKDKDNKLIDRVILLSGYDFYCHDQIRNELLRDTNHSPSEWLMKQIMAGKVICYSDKHILSGLERIYGENASLMYARMMNTACEAYRRDYFSEHFPSVASLDYSSVGIDDFLAVLEKDCSALNTDCNLGELKTYVLLQFMTLTMGQMVYIFCSDDRNARNAILNIGEVRCISVLSSFCRLRIESDFSEVEAEPYIQSYLAFLKRSNQETFRIQNGSKPGQFTRMPCDRVFDELFSGRLEEAKNGNLKLKDTTDTITSPK